jgi:hypothetical protein
VRIGDGCVEGGRGAGDDRIRDGAGCRNGGGDAKYNGCELGIHDEWHPDAAFVA